MAASFTGSSECKCSSELLFADQVLDSLPHMNSGILKPQCGSQKCIHLQYVYLNDYVRDNWPGSCYATVSTKDLQCGTVVWHVETVIAISFIHWSMFLWLGTPSFWCFFAPCRMILHSFVLMVSRPRRKQRNAYHKKFNWGFIYWV